MENVPYTDIAFNPTPDEESCLFMSKYKLYRISCPFQVTCLVETKDFLKGEKVEVKQVVGWDERTLLYRVVGKLYPHCYFIFNPPSGLVITRLK